MRRKNRKWVAIAAGLYLLVMYSAVRWSIGQRRPGEVSLFTKIERDGIRRLAEERAKKKAEEAVQPTGEPHLTAAGPAYVAARYDQTHVVFIVATDTESRFSSSPLIRSGNPTRIPEPIRPAGRLAGLQELWTPDSTSLHFFPKIIQTTHPGDQWILDLSPDSTIPVFIERPVIAPTGCSLALGFLASIPAAEQQAFFASGREYFVVRRTPVEPTDTPAQSHISALPDWNVSPSVARQIEQQLTERMKKEVAAIDARLVANAGTPGAAASESPMGSARPRIKEWLHADQGLTQGEGKLDYDVRAFNLSPDSIPRFFVRARWTLAGSPVFLMTAWLKADAQTTLLSADSSWSTAQREGEASATLGDSLNFQIVLNEFDADHDGWAELLVHSFQGSSTTITLYLYTDKGLVPLKAPFRRDLASADACLDP